MFTKFFIIITGPTAVGKTDFADYLSKKLNFKTEILNADLGQFYTPLNIGTAKPDLEKVSNYSLFNILNEPKDFTAFDFKELIFQKIQELWLKNIIPIIVGGSLFYIKTLFFQPKQLSFKNSENIDFSENTTEDLYNKLISVDKLRACEINKNDRYRIEVALNLWYKSGLKPSDLKSDFSMPLNSKVLFYYLNRDRKELYDIINKRTEKLFQSGFIEEVDNLDCNWKNFLIRKKIIGYNDILENRYLDINKLVEKVSQRTRNYAKKQIIFWQKFMPLLINRDNLLVKEINLNFEDVDLHIEKLKLDLNLLLN